MLVASSRTHLPSLDLGTAAPRWNAYPVAHDAQSWAIARYIRHRHPFRLSQMSSPAESANHSEWLGPWVMSMTSSATSSEAIGWSLKLPVGVIASAV